MLDRESSFDDKDVARFLSERYVPVALDVWYEENRRDVAGELYRKIVRQRKNRKEGHTSQGFYIATPNGILLDGWNNRDPERLRKRLRLELSRYQAIETTDERGPPDARYERRLPRGAAVVDVRSKILEASYGTPGTPWQEIHRHAIGRDHLWILAEEIGELAKGRWPAALTRRLARYHLVDNTRGEPPFWSPQELQDATLTFEKGVLAGRVRLATSDHTRWYEAALYGVVTLRDDRLTGFDILARGTFFGEGRWTSGAPKTPFKLAVAFRLTNPDASDAIVPPQGARSLLPYLKSE